MKALLPLFIFALTFTSSWGNNINVSNITLENQNEAQNWIQVEFDLSWENSWRISSGPSNWDAAWVFIKYRVNSGDWTHATLSQTDNRATSESTIDVSTDNLGAIIYRNKDGSGNINFQDLRLRWNYGSIGANDVIDVQVFAIEMVYVPEGAFYLGGTEGDEKNKFYSGSTNISYQVTSENAIDISPGAGKLYYNLDVGNGGDQLGPIPANFPKGFAAFYAMKYEVSQGQFVAFFNTLTEAQKITNDVTGPNGKNNDGQLAGNTIAWSDGTSAATTSTPDISLNYINTAIMNAYLDWAGLRYMTELEYEKSCRGPVPAKAGEFAWGNANISTTSYTISNAGTATERVSNPEQGTGNAAFGNNTDVLKPLRNGIFAASAVTNNREETGGSYYGIMELSGNVYERCISIGIPQGRTFDGSHGDGVLGTSGEGNVPNWPLPTGEGISYRGGGFPNGMAFLRVSDRYDGGLILASNANSRLGLRGVRSAN